MVSRNRLSLVVKNDGLVDMTPNAAPTGTYSNVFKVNKFAFTGTPTAKTRKGALAERAITDTVQYMGWMSLKDSDHSGTTKDVSQAQERRAAADRLIASGTVVLLGTWSNGIAVGPGVGFSAATNEPEVIAPVRTMKVRKPRAAAKPGYQKWQEESDHIMAGRTCPWSPDVMHGPAFVAKPRVRVPLATMQACSPRWMPTLYVLTHVSGKQWHTDSAHTSEASAVLRKGLLQNENICTIIREEPAQPATAPPTPIYTPSVGDTVAITYQHERMTTDRIVNVQRVAADGKTFRGYDRTYDRVRNYDMARVLTIRRLGGEGVEIAAG
jgi:hypothetical protein